MNMYSINLITDETRLESANIIHARQIHSKLRKGLHLTLEKRF